MRSQSTDTRLLVAGVVAFLALVVYLAVAFANTHASAGVRPKGAPYYGSWVPYASKMSRLPSGRREGLAFRVIPTTQRSYYGALVPTLASDPPPGRKWVVGLWLKGASPGRIGVEVDEFSPGATSVYIVNTTVPATARWHHFSFPLRVKGRWLGLGMYVYRLRQTEFTAQTWFAVRGLKLGLRRG